MFRVQLAALALDRAGLLEPPREEVAWRDLLLPLTDGAIDPCFLVGVDCNCPAFLQPPDPGGLKWEPVPTPDALDVLITSRDHNLKGAVAVRAAPEVTPA
jgi:CRISPR system Cascade subunit CasA